MSLDQTLKGIERAAKFGKFGSVTQGVRYVGIAYGSPLNGTDYFEEVTRQQLEAYGWGVRSVSFRQTGGSTLAVTIDLDTYCDFSFEQMLAFVPALNNIIYASVGAVGTMPSMRFDRTTGECSNTGTVYNAGQIATVTVHTGDTGNNSSGNGNNNSNGSYWNNLSQLTGGNPNNPNPLNSIDNFLFNNAGKLSGVVIGLLVVVGAAIIINRK